MERLLDRFAKVFSFGLAIDAASPGARPWGSRDAAQQEALSLIASARSAALAGGTPAAQVESASFAVVAWLDEILARQTHWTDERTPLQVQLFNSGNAQSEFFHHLAALQADDDEVREVYWHAMAHGFVGQYYFEQGDDGELGKLKALHGRRLRTPPRVPATLAADGIPPQRSAGPDATPIARPFATPSATPEVPGPRDPLRRDRRLLRIGGALALLLPLLALLYLLLAEPDAVPAAHPELARHLTGYACSDLGATAAADGTPRVTGFVPLPDDVARVEREVRALPGLQAAQFDIRVRVWPHCEVVDILKPYQARNREKGFGLQLAAPSARDGMLREGEPVRIQLTGAQYDGYVQVDYFTADGAVQHLNRGPAEGRVVAGQGATFGKDIPSSWLVSPPFGPVLVSVLASPAPFVEIGEQPPFELASTYLLKLREALAANKGGDRVIAEMLVLETAER